MLRAAATLSLLLVVIAVVVADPQFPVNVSLCQDYQCIDTDCSSGSFTTGICSGPISNVGSAIVTCNINGPEMCFNGVFHYGQSPNDCNLAPSSGTSYNTSIACNSCFSPISQTVWYNTTCDEQTGDVFFSRVEISFGAQFGCQQGTAQTPVAAPIGTCADLQKFHWFQRVSGLFPCQTATVQTYDDASCGDLTGYSTVPLDTCSDAFIVSGCPALTTLPTSSTAAPPTTEAPPTTSSTTGVATSAPPPTPAPPTNAPTLAPTPVPPTPSPPPATAAPAPSHTAAPGFVDATCSSQGTSLFVNGTAVNLQQIPQAVLQDLKQESGVGFAVTLVVDLCTAMSAPGDNSFPACPTGEEPAVKTWFLQIYDSNQQCTNINFDRMTSKPVVAADNNMAVDMEFRNFARGLIAHVRILCRPQSDDDIPLSSVTGTFKKVVADGWSTYTFQLASSAICGATTSTTVAAGGSTTAVSDGVNGNAASNGDSNKTTMIVAGVAGFVVLLAIVLGVAFWYTRRRNRSSMDYAPVVDVTTSIDAVNVPVVEEAAASGHVQSATTPQRQAVDV